MPRIERLAELTVADREAIVAVLNASTRSRGFVWAPTPLALVVRADEGALVGGLVGELHWGWLRISLLAVAEEYRGGGWGRALVAEAERLAREAGCHSAWVDTFSFQAPDFYQHLGYRIFGTLPDYPPGQMRYFLARTLAVSSPTEGP